MNIVDYVRMTKDITFEEDPLNEVDSLIFSQIAYFNFEIFNGRTSIEISEMENKKEIDRLVERTWDQKNNKLLIRQLSHSRRFKNIVIHNPINIFSFDEEQQFSAISFELPNNIMYISFRGTNSTFVGWKEDFNMTYLDTIPSQRSALLYLEKASKLFECDFYLGGHSKGGNLAMYAGAFFKEQSRVLQVFNHDGPGLNSFLKGAAEYQSVQRKFQKFVPEASIIGMLIESGNDFLVIKSNASLFMQHNPYTWQVNGNKFHKLASVNALSDYSRRTVLTLLQSVDIESRKEFVSSLYEISTSTNAEYLVDAIKPNSENVKSVFKSIRNAVKSRKILIRVTKLIVKASIHQLKTT